MILMIVTRKSRELLDIFVLVPIMNFRSHWFEAVRSSKHDAPFTKFFDQMKPNDGLHWNNQKIQ